MHMPNAAAIPLEDLATKITLPPTPFQAIIATFAHALADSQHNSIVRPHSNDPERRLPSFVDDSASAHTHQHIQLCINLSVWAARQLFGFPHEAPPQPPCINPTKWLTLVNFILKFLGFLINTRRMLVIWPVDKRDKLAHLLDTLVVEQTAPTVGSSPCHLACILGLLHHGAFVAPLGVLQTLRLQFRLNDLVSKARGTPQQQRRWWGSHRLRLPAIIKADLASLRATLDQDLYNP